MKITNKELRTIIKEEIEKVLNEAFKSEPTQGDLQRLKRFDDRQRAQRGLRGPQIYKALPGDNVESIKQDPNIPPKHKEKLISLFMSGPEGRNQAKELMNAMGYGVESIHHTKVGPHERVRNPFKDDPHDHDLYDRGYGNQPTYRGGDSYYEDDEF